MPEAQKQLDPVESQAARCHPMLEEYTAATHFARCFPNLELCSTIYIWLTIYMVATMGEISDAEKPTWRHKGEVHGKCPSRWPDKGELQEERPPLMFPTGSLTRNEGIADGRDYTKYLPKVTFQESPRLRQPDFLLPHGQS